MKSVISFEQGRWGKSIAWYVVLGFLTCSAISCGTSPVPAETGWVGVNMGKMVVREQDRVSDQDIFQLSVGDESIVIELMLESGAGALPVERVAGIRVPDEARARVEQLGGRLYLIRAVSGDVSGKFAAHRNGGMISVQFGTFGDCGLRQRRVLLLRLDRLPEDVLGGCDGAL